MIVPAIIYKDEILKKLSGYKYTDDMMYYSGWLGDRLPEIQSDSDGNRYQFAIVDKDKLIGYFTYNINWYSRCMSQFGLFSFDRGNAIIGFDVRKELKKAIQEYHIHRIEWRMIEGNHAERSYDNFCNNYWGNKIILKDVFKDKYGNYHNVVIYEIVFNN